MGKVMGVVGLLVGAVLAVALAWLLGMRNKTSAVVAAQRKINRSVFNPRQMESAGTPGAYAAVIRHTGRTSGRPYETPVGAEPTADGFSIALMYGSRSDWLRNVLSAGSATIVHDGQEYPVDSPELVPFTDATADFPAEDLRALRLFGVKEVLRVRRAD